MKANELPPVELLRELFDYDPETGDITWKVDRKSNKVKGKKAGSVWSDGYLHISIDRKCYIASRICWALHYGCDPHPYEIDHIDRNPLNNRIGNLRRVGRSENNLNRTLKVGGSGHKYITRKTDKGHTYYVVRVRGRWCGQRKTIEEAILLRDSVE